MDLRGVLKTFPKRKKIDANSSPKASAKIPKREGAAAGGWLSSLQAYVVPTGIGRARAELFEKQIVQHGGQLCSAEAPGITHIVVDEGMDYERALRLLRLPRLPPGAQLVKSAWLSLCLQERRLVDTAGFSIFIPDRYLDQPQLSKGDQVSSPGAPEALLTTACSSPTLPTRPVSPPQRAEETSSTLPQPGLDDETSDGEEAQVNAADLEALISGHYPTPPEGDGEPSSAPEGLNKWVCAQPSSQKATNHNSHITEKLEVLAKAYSVQGDKWRALSYAKAINALKSFHKAVTSYQEACHIPGIGKRMAEKIEEILESGHLRKLDHISESVPVLELFSNIWGAGTKTAQMWYHQGFRTLEDIRNQASLTTQQAVGLKHYSDFLERMPREEATEIQQTVWKAAQAFNPGLLCVACGSYRRGKATCGDVDVLITHPDGRSHQGIFSPLLDHLRQQGFLTDDLVSQEENGQQQKYLGVCRLPGPGRRHRRLDIIVVPYSEFACALLYFTGSAHFNRSMRALAKTKGMSLSEHALSTAVVRDTQGLKVGPGRVLPTPTEKDVFSLLGLPYREPAERDW
ncbi:PREDICTED: DNA polymerase lambda isoform X1 [Condylura cristata]|uniref:DNA polymerase lambda isoform X1 n=2 Tax=Condylura cristata TaxID=143302 RepID=UPI000334521C|nr:PREDICTED: DNA polymerase lambda isoform X1 [Condylura cristata]XP_012579088.1 PREDICTED: DNA polymerase lambda isoform X1 [Condylura cristata]XP_012579089.1 PREDICTED: DNA polymerase lambda isoform X1 [Condylura cristata]XP_012579090.1 PREDICTED: DNA polymerase lambda isoform X1 [Condylura cristata]